MLRINLKFRQDFENHVILIQLSEQRGDLALSETVVKRVVDILRRDAHARGRLAVKGERDRPGRASAGRSRRRPVPAEL